MTVETWQKLTPTTSTERFIASMPYSPACSQNARNGIIININSVSGKRAGPLGGVAYAASKFGMSAWESAWPAEEKDSGIRAKQ